MSTTSVSSLTALQTALDTARSGDTVLVEAGQYGELSIRYADGITIRAADPDRPAEFESISVYSSQNVILEGLTVDFPVTEETTEVFSGVRMLASDHITLRDCTIIGGDAIGGIDPDSPAGAQGSFGITGYPIGRGITAIRVNDLVIEGTEISDVNQGMALSQVNGLVIRDSHVFDTRSTPIAGSRLDNVLIEGNHFEEVSSWKLGGQGDHSDFIHIYTGRDQTTLSRNFVIRDNFFDQGSGDAIMSIYFSTFDDTPAGFSNVTIANNVVSDSERNAIRLNKIDGLKVISNTLLPTDDNPKRAPGIVLDDGIRNALIDGNIVAFISGESFERAAANGIVVRNNLAVQANDPLEPLYIGNLFGNALGEDVTLADLYPLPGSPAEGFGAAGALFAEVTPWAIASEHDTGPDLDLHRLSVATLFGLTDLSDDDVTWLFEDGSTDRGISVEHRFETAGDTLVRAYLDLDGDRSPDVILDKLLATRSPLAIEADFDVGLRDISGIENPVTAIGALSRVAHDGGGALSLDSAAARLGFEWSDEILDNDAFTISFAYARDAATLGGSGFALYFAGTAAIRVGEDWLSLGGRTDLDESVSMRVNGIDVDNTDWHQITYTFSQSAGTATLYFDGQAVAQTTGLKGAQYSPTGHDLHLGGAYGSSLRGDYDDLVFLRYALDDDAVAGRYAAFSGTEPEATPAPEAEPAPKATPAPVILSPLAIEADFDVGLRDISGIENPVTAIGALSRVAHDGGGALSLDSAAARLAFERSDEILDNDAFTISFAYARDAATLGGSGFALYFAGTAAIRVGEDWLSLGGRTDLDESVSMRVNGIDVDNTDWHQITYTFSQSAGTATLYFDGEAVAQTTGLKGAQYSPIGHDLHLGGAFGSSLRGDYDDLVFLQYALDDDAVAARYAAFSGTEPETALLPTSPMPDQTSEFDLLPRLAGNPAEAPQADLQEAFAAFDDTTMAFLNGYQQEDSLMFL